MTSEKRRAEEEQLPEPSDAQENWKPEIEAMMAICSTLQPRNHGQRVRIMGSALCMYDQAMAERVMRWWRDTR